MKKKGISAVVATVLIIMIVVVGIGIVWKVILPLFAELEFLSYSDVQLKIVRQGFTVYDEDQHFAFVQIERGADEVNMTGIEIGFNFNGTSKTYQSVEVPTPGGKYTYKFNFTNDSDMGIPQNVTPNKVTVAPIFTINSKVRLGKVLDSEDMPVGRARLSAAEWEKANNDSKGPVPIKPGPCGDCPGEPVPPVVPVIVSLTYYLDSDNDGYANDSVSQSFEEGKNDSGYILTLGDCDDGESTIYPGALDVANNAIDENCDGWAEVDSCQTLDVDGTSYLLTGEIPLSSGHCFTITGQNIILNLGGNSITGPNNWQYNGIRFLDADYSKVYNGKLDGFKNGVKIINSDYNTIQDIDVSYNYFSGVLIEPTVSATGNVIDNVNSSNSFGGYGFQIQIQTSGASVTNTTFKNLYSCGNGRVDSGINCNKDKSGTIADVKGDNNVFGPDTLDGWCDVWPVRDTHYTLCP